MGTFVFSRRALSIGAVALLLGGCAGSQPSIDAPGAMLEKRAVLSASTHSDLARSYRVLHSFGQGSDGSEPQGTLLDVSGTLYGVTSSGGSNAKGTVFSMTTSGIEQVLYSFDGGTDGEFPNSGVIEVNGTLYGTTKLGGAYAGSYGGGTVYSISASGVETVLHSFGDGRDGEMPEGPLIYVNGALYGTTIEGGKYGLGTLFSITASGTEHVVHSFGKGNDGSHPVGSLLDVNGRLYGTTQKGGNSQCYGGGCGTVFSSTLRGAEKVLYSFSGNPDGDDPSAGLIDVGGTLYGTTQYGGTYTGYAQGTVFSITLSGTEKVLHSFGGDRDGWNPSESLVDVKGMLYGTTWNGPGNCGDCGTIFSVNRVGKEQVLLGFDSYAHRRGRIPLGLININATLYGVAFVGGRYGYGTAFTFEP